MFFNSSKFTCVAFQSLIGSLTLEVRRRCMGESLAKGEIGLFVEGREKLEEEDKLP